MYTDRLRSAPAIEPLRVLPVVLISLFVVVAAVDLLLASQPPLIASLRDTWQHAMNVGGVPATWGSLLAAGIAVAGVAFAAAVLSAFIRGAHAAPYATLAPVLVGCCTLVLGRMPVSLPMPVTPPVFAGLATLMLIGGGNLFRSSGFFMNSAGALLATTPLALLWAGYFGSGTSAHPFDRNAQVFLFVLGFASIGAPLLAIACRRPRRANWSDNADELGGQIVELLERAEASEARAAAAERQLSGRGRGFRLSSDDDALSMMRPASSPWMRLASWFCFAAFLAGAYFAGYVPLQKRLVTQMLLNKTQTDQHAEALTALRARFELERQELEKQLTAAQSGAPAHGVAPKANAPSPATGRAATTPDAAAKGTGAPVVTPRSATQAPPQPTGIAKPAAPDATHPKAAVPAPSEGTPKAKLAPAPNEKQAQPNTAPASKENVKTGDVPEPSDASKAEPAADKPVAAPHAAHAAPKTAEKHKAAQTSPKQTGDEDKPAAPAKARAGVSRANDPLEGLDGM